MGTDDPVAWLVAAVREADAVRRLVERDPAPLDAGVYRCGDWWVGSVSVRPASPSSADP